MSYVNLINKEFFLKNNPCLTNRQVNESVSKLENLIKDSGIDIVLDVEPAYRHAAEKGYTLYLIISYSTYSLEYDKLYALFNFAGVSYGDGTYLSRQYIKI